MAIFVIVVELNARGEMVGAVAHQSYPVTTTSVLSYHNQISSPLSQPPYQVGAVALLGAGREPGAEFDRRQVPPSLHRITMSIPKEVVWTNWQ
jgi:hypothetical protein